MFRSVSRRELRVGARGLGLASAVTMVLGGVFGVSSAVAVPNGEYAVFAQCPLAVSGLNGCLVGDNESGEIKIGKESVPISSTQTLQGGFIEHGEPALTFVGAANGETLSRTPESVPVVSRLC